MDRRLGSSPFRRCIAAPSLCPAPAPRAGLAFARFPLSAPLRTLSWEPPADASRFNRDPRAVRISGPIALPCGGESSMRPVLGVWDRFFESSGADRSTLPEDQVARTHWGRYWTSLLLIGLRVLRFSQQCADVLRICLAQMFQRSISIRRIVQALLEELHPSAGLVDDLRPGFYPHDNW